ncbi:MAG: caspase family protein [Oculatellaceae cyanobacterium Prado106]|jgi:WD40 repeat protein/uncharacterized caspase-like protein|nr:caspase family protein [Oculatellaceae cyanobacterium Prado106]
MCPAILTTSRTHALTTGAAKLWVLLVGVNHYEDDRFPNLAYSAQDCQGLGEAIALATQAFPERMVRIHHDFAGSREWGVGSGEWGEEGEGEKAKGERGKGKGEREEGYEQEQVPHSSTHPPIHPSTHPLIHPSTHPPIHQQAAIAGHMRLKTVAQLRSFPAHRPELEEVRSSLKEICAAARPEDTVLFYFSGHGVLEPETQQAVLCLSQTRKDQLMATGLGIQEVLDLLGQCAAHQQLVWLDACHSGGMTLRAAKGEKGEREDSLPNPTPQLMELLRHRAAQSKGFYALLSCDQTQQSWEFPELGHGVFTYYLMRGLLGEAADAQGVVEADALYKYVYYQTLRYIDKTNQQLRLINQQKRGRGDTQIQPEYPQQTPKRIVEGVGELILGIQGDRSTQGHLRQALVIDGLTASPTTLDLSRVLRNAGGFNLTYFPQAGKDWMGVKEAIARTLQTQEPDSLGGDRPWGDATTALLYLRGRVEQTEAGEARLLLKDGVELSRSGLRQMLRKSAIARQIVILDCPGAAHLDEWVEDLQIATGRGQCLIAVASPADDPQWFSHMLLDMLKSADPQVGLPIAGLIAQIQTQAISAGRVAHVWLSGSQGVIEILPGQMGARGEAPEFDLGVCPYLGLRAFSEDDAPFFFGRESLTQAWVNLLRSQSCLAVIGASGSGKSSLVQAGLVAQLRQGQQIPGGQDWWIGTMRPGARPLEALVQRWVERGTEKEREYQRLHLEGMIYQGAEGFVYGLRSRPEPMIVLVVDQFEELFTLASAEDRQRFLELVLGALEFAGDRFKLILTLRSDFIAPCLEYPALAQVLQRSSVMVPPVLEEEGYRQVILRPAEKVGLTVEPELVEVLLQEMNHAAGDLPLLEFVLEQLWEHRQPGQLTLQVYQQQIGGLRGALEQKAQSVYDSLNAEEQACARWIFLSLTQLGEGTEDTRRRVLKSDLVVKKYPEALVERVLQTLTAAKLITVDVEEEIGKDAVRDSVDHPGQLSKEISLSAELESLQDPTFRPPSPPTLGGTEHSLEKSTFRGAADLEDLGDAQRFNTDCSTVSSVSSLPDLFNQSVTIEVVHEILIRHWSTLRWWLEENRTRLRSQRQMEHAADQWRHSGQQEDFLLRGVRLDAAEELYVRYTDELSQDVQLFIEAGLQERDRQKNQAQHRLKQAQRAIALISILGIAAVGFGGFAFLQRQRALWNEITALNALSESQLLAAQQLEAIATSLKAGQQLRQFPSLGISNSDQAKLRLQTEATMQQAIETTQERNRLEGHSQRVNRVALSPDGQWIVSGSDDATVRIWQINGALAKTLTLSDRVTDLSFSPNGRSLAAATADGKVTLLNAADGTMQRSLSIPASTPFVTSIAFSPSGQMLAIASRSNSGTQKTAAHALQLWNLADGKLLKTFAGHEGWVNQVQFSPDGKVLASASEDQRVKLWDVAQGNLIRDLQGHGDRVTSLSFSPDGKTLVSGSGDKTLKLWDWATGSATKTLEGHTEQINSVQFSRDGRWIVSASQDQSLRLWQAEDGLLLTQLRGHGAAVLSAIFSPDRPLIISASADNSIRLWDVPTLDKTPNRYTAIATQPNQPWIATAQDRIIQLHRQVRQNLEARNLTGHQQPVSALRFSPNSQQLASGSDDQTLMLWTMADRRLLATLKGHKGRINDIAYSPDGQILASASEDRTIRFWKATDGHPIRALTGHQDAVSRVAFSPDGSLLASGSYDNTVKIWRVRDGQLLQTLTGHGLAIAALTFSPDGQTLASASWDNTIRLWTVTNGQPLRTLAGHEGGVTSLSFSSNGQVLASGSEDQTLKLWTVADGSLLKTLRGERDRILGLQFTPQDQSLLRLGEVTGVQVLDLELSTLLGKGCDRLRDYLTTNSHAQQQVAPGLCP